MRAVILCLAVMLISSCQTAKKEHGTTVTQEVGSVWNRVADDPPTYVPKGYPACAPRSDAKGEWVVSQLDGRRFFIPPGGVGDKGSAELSRSARRAIDPCDNSLAKQERAEIAGWIALSPFFPFLLARDYGGADPVVVDWRYKEPASSD